MKRLIPSLSESSSRRNTRVAHRENKKWKDSRTGEGSAVAAAARAGQLKPIQGPPGTRLDVRQALLIRQWGLVAGKT